jgi:DNA invertase Pin-like site-specific DNA recombinase
MKIGYARVSTLDQNLNLQTDALEKAGCEKILTDTASSTLDAREGLRNALEFCREGDSLIVWKLGRLGRSLKHLIGTVNQLQAKGIRFVSLQESVDTKTSGGKLMFHIFGNAGGI